MAAPRVNINDLKVFHRIDRDLYRRLVIDLGRDVMQSMEIIALWQWMEDAGYPSIIYIMRSVSDEMVDAAAEEALSCLRCMVSETDPLLTGNNDDLPVTQTLVGDKPISLQYLYENRGRAGNNVRRTVNTVYRSVFDDIFEQALSLMSNDEEAANVDMFDNNNRIIRGPIRTPGDDPLMKEQRYVKDLYRFYLKGNNRNSRP
ncbi:hypothetical protein BVC80_1835g544 [Macleaya cordata]|uniref:Uncharacterized protein n=1 Tax=Macleaya cordata TaxID=56857 RepID=A0A200R613_MACCD|nr:hypothetical protein BVC80_1835g544 [Macleaya cordata]